MRRRGQVGTEGCEYSASSTENINPEDLKGFSVAVLVRTQHVDVVRPVVAGLFSRRLRLGQVILFDQEVDRMEAIPLRTSQQWSGVALPTVRG